MNLKETAEEVVIEPSSAAGAAVIWLHGLGADGHDFVPIVPEMRLPPDPPVRFVFPHAPVRPVTINAGMRMRAWFDIPSLQDLRRQDEAGIRESERIARGYVQRELDAGIPTGRIVLAGFSQGGAIALHTALRYEQKLAGCLALSTFLPLAERLAAEAQPANRDTPILMCHGRYDPVLPMAFGQYSRELLESMGYRVEWREYPMQHQVCVEEIADVAKWLRERLAAGRNHEKAQRF